MKKQLKNLTVILLICTMILGALAACSSKGNTETQATARPEGTEGESPSESVATTEKENSSETQGSVETEDGSETEKDTEGKENYEFHESQLIGYADSIKNGVQFGFTDYNRSDLRVENLEMILNYATAADKSNLVTRLSNKNGNAYIENTMDVFVTMSDGGKYYASNSYASTSANAFRFGYYFYEVRIQDQIFTNALESTKGKKVSHTSVHYANQCETALEDGVLKVTNAIDATDPYVDFSRAFSYTADNYPILKLTMKADIKVNGGSLFFITDNAGGYESSKTVPFTIINDGEVHEYFIPLVSNQHYKGILSGLRLDINGSGACYEVVGMELLKGNADGAPEGIVLSRSFLTYSDKMHHVIQIAATEEVAGITAVGMETKIDANTVAKLILEDKNGIRDTIDGADWASVKYIGFDIIDTGIFGYILPFNGSGGTIEVTLSDGVYTVVQTQIPAGNKIVPSVKGTKNANDFYMSQRVYTDSNHDFEEFLNEAYCEINPLTENMVKISSNSTSGATFGGYDPVRGIYRFNLPSIGGGFDTPYFKTPNKHYGVSFTIRGDDHDRKMYFMTYTPTGSLECAVLLDENDLMLPVPIEVGKNFSEEAGDRNIFNLDDATYGEAIFPLVISAKQKVTYRALNLYQRWGNFPLKQLSWIQFHSPYYHLSTGVVETNCILPWSYTPWTYVNNFKGLNTLPDFRPMSAPFWKTQPQHTSCGTHTWLVYTDAKGFRSTYECTENLITSYGPIYAEVTMDYISDDGRIKSTYTHMEMPQTDENRTYYSITHEVLEDISFNDFSRDFEFYRVSNNDPTGVYTQLGYLNEQNECVVTDAIKDASAGTVEYVLGDNCPYFSLFNMENSTKDNGYSNLGFIICNSSAVIGGVETVPQFSIAHAQNYVALSLNYDELTLKKGDKITINCILLPWGSQESVYDGSTGIAPDQNVRNVREDTALDPIKATPVSDCEKVESVYIPKIKSTNGKSATFTVSGGSRSKDVVWEGGRNNIAVRVYGFEMLTAPSVEELVNGEWVEYEINSFNNPDGANYAHSYDGYGVYYDGNGTFSYAFIIDMTEGEERTFRVSANKEFEGWPEEPGSNGSSDDLLDLYCDAAEINERATGSQFITSSEVSDDGSYVRLSGTNGKGEGYLYLIENNSNESGHFLVVKYRVPKENTNAIGQFQFYVSTTNDRATGPEMVRCCDKDIVADGEWHLLVIDLLKVAEGTDETATAKPGFIENVFVPDTADGKYYSKYLRFDFFDRVMADTDYIDLAYVGMDNSLEDISSLAIMDQTAQYTLIEGITSYTVDPNTNQKVDNSPNTAPKLDSYVTPDSNYKLSELHFVTVLDAVNGKSAKYTANFMSEGIITVEYNGKTVKDGDASKNILHSGTHLIASGWAVVEGGISKYVWSVDGGKTWNDAEYCGMTAPRSAVEAMINRSHDITKNTFTFTLERDGALASFQGTDKATFAKGVCANLKDYVGQTVHVIFAAVPAKDTSSICPIAYVTGVEVVAEEENVAPDLSEYIKEGSGFTASENHYASCVDIINGKQYTGAVRYSDTGNNGITTMAYGAKTVDVDDNTKEGTYMRLSGWAVAESGISRLLWSADGGSTWHEVDPSCMTDSNSKLINDGANRRGTPYNFTVERDVKGGNFQSGRLAFDLAAYSGKTVNVILAAEPVDAQGTLCIIANITGVTVP